MIASAMEGKRLGLHNKTLITVPNHLTEQIGDDFIKLYPSANILVAKKEDFIKENRQKLCAKIATGDFDAVIIGHSQLIKIPVSRITSYNVCYTKLLRVMIMMKMDGNISNFMGKKQQRP